jgi:catechol 2,3-dioxygenase-like lactoylglutathione lyase family enzyme
MPELQAILEAALYCDDLDRAERFYTEVFGLERITRDPHSHVFFRCGPTVLLLFDPASTEDAVRQVKGAVIPTHGTRGAGHLAFRVEPDSRQQWRDHLARHDVAIESEVDWPGGGWSIYFRDPAGNSLELATAALWGLDA